MRAAVAQREDRGQQFTVACVQCTSAVAVQLESDLEVDGIRWRLGDGRGQINARALQVRSDAYRGECSMSVPALLQIEDASPACLAGQPGQPGRLPGSGIREQPGVAQMGGEVHSRCGALDLYPNSVPGLRRSNAQRDRAAEVQSLDPLGLESRTLEGEDARYLFEALLEARRVHAIVSYLKPAGYLRTILLSQLGKQDEEDRIHRRGFGASPGLTGQP